MTEEYIQDTVDSNGHHTSKHVTKGDGFQQIEISSDRPLDPADINFMIQQAIQEMAMQAPPPRMTTQLPAIIPLFPLFDLEALLQELDEIAAEEEFERSSHVITDLENKAQSDSSEWFSGVMILGLVCAVFYAGLRVMKS